MADKKVLEERSTKEVATQRDYAIQKFAKDLLDTVDVLGMAKASIPAEFRNAESIQKHTADEIVDKLTNLYTGMTMTETELVKTLKRHGVEKLELQQGKQFDATKAQSVLSKEIPGKEPGTIFTVKKSGYTIRGRMLRHAQVGVVAEKRSYAAQAATQRASQPPSQVNSLKTTLCFSITDKVGALENCLTAIKAMDVSLTRIESRPSRTSDWDYDFFVDLKARDAVQVNNLVEGLRAHTADVRVIGADGNALDSVPWFPRKMTDLDTFSEKVLEMGGELSSDHPGAHDPEYRARRADITRMAKAFRTGDPVPRVDYTPAENDAWGQVYRRLTQMYKTHACREHQYVFPLLEQNCGYSDKEIPQLETVSRFLKDCTGFQIRPVMGLLTSRDFLNAFAFRVFHSTQYIRHPSQPFYTPEPDVCHELLGHAPLFADPDFADFSQEIGLASLGASDEDVKKLATIFWFTAEFGVCRQGDELRAYGAGLLSSFGELEYSLSDKPEHRPFEPEKTAVTEYPITTFQPVYYVADSFKDAQEKVRNFAATMNRPFSVRYNALTQTIEVLDTKDKVVRFAKGIRDDMKTLTTVIESLSH
ncbi:Biopterin-dependent aromatic amino acid hydroxylase-domain-containing protein [Zychaea mexicana]|uniref:Biopterin-dependent aromatic amino acid hydroxylase-domain-containing protein n=1 Tax=Zychaea mexicana TaxID=64656 RepID=UPI0022FDD918|nr:Biopterin-dependent aromatic amino acid hydroxylase-domain-containing protein [Zychaea mexicana]KAI9490664.1 Biopterin-dependent aromatic amino acid hydroxylase-domain-containing protein [Zychaea mexicana]